jgi:hypothetical protein
MKPRAALCEPAGYVYGDNQLRRVAVRRKLRRPWSREDDRRLLEMIRDGRPRAWIAAALKRSVAAIAGRLKVLRAATRESRSPSD